EEAARGKADLVVAYHPPLFHPLKRLTQREPAERVLLAAISAGIAIYSPHTAVDAAPGGVNDWLADGLGAGLKRSLVLPRAPVVPAEDSADLQPVIGQGRELILKQPVSLATLVKRIKRHLRLARVRVAAAARHTLGEPIKTVALCAGAGGSVIGSSGADLLLTGEMGHHQVLAEVAASSSVVLCDHTNTERGYLPVLARRLEQGLSGEVNVAVSLVDADPLVIT
ncbi:MAG: Nif3-like dinuclear metal center hexameric protein, partial [Planctomycetota bacterium]